MCEIYDQKCRKPSDSITAENTTCSSLQQCEHTPGITPACYALFGQSKDGGRNVILKGCISQNDQHCTPSSVCNGQRKNLRKLPSLYYCCCTSDRCNRDVVMFISEETTDKDQTLKGGIHIDCKTAVLSPISLIVANSKTARPSSQKMRLFCSLGFTKLI